MTTIKSRRHKDTQFERNLNTYRHGGRHGFTLFDCTMLTHTKNVPQHEMAAYSAAFDEGRVLLRVAERESMRKALAKLNLNGEFTTVSFADLHRAMNAAYTDALTANQIVASNIRTANQITAGAITAQPITVDSLSNVTSNIGTIHTDFSKKRVLVEDGVTMVYDANCVCVINLGKF